MRRPDAEKLYLVKGCPATNYDANGSIFIPDPLECRHTAMVARLKDRLEELQCHCVDNP